MTVRTMSRQQQCCNRRIQRCTRNMDIVPTSSFHDLQVEMWVPLQHIVDGSDKGFGQFEQGERSRDRISESVMRIFSGMSAATFDLTSRLRRSCPCTSCFSTTPDSFVLRSASTAAFLSSISRVPMRCMSWTARSRPRERAVGCVI